MKRLFIGGLGHSVSEKDLKDRFGKFGDVTDVEIVTRKDDQGAPLKTFGYININITDDGYKRCVGVLNKSTWKGGTLIIQLAKESFLHKLKEERQQMLEKRSTPAIAPRETLKDSFKAVGVDNFHMKAAVPGTEIPGHKGWVVGKFGRVLPVLNLKAEEDFTPVSNLTWKLEAGDDEISRKRRGEFPKQKHSPKKRKVDVSLFLSSGINAPRTAPKQNVLPSNVTGNQRKSVCVFNNDTDSEDELKMLVAQEKLRSQTLANDSDDNLEVVGDDFKLKSNTFWGECGVLTKKEDEEYDSADTGEIFVQKKTPKPSENLQSQPNESKCFSVSGDDSSIDSDYEAMMGNCYRLDLTLADLEQLSKNTEEECIEKPKTAKVCPKRPGNTPEDILASLLKDNTPEMESKKKKKISSAPLLAFVGTKELFGDPNPILKTVSQKVDRNKRLKQDTKLKKQSVSSDKSLLNSSNSQSSQEVTSSSAPSMSKTLESEESLSGEPKVSPKTLVPAKSGTKVKPKVPTNTTNTPMKPNQIKSASTCSTSQLQKKELSALDSPLKNSSQSPRTNSGTKTTKSVKLSISNGDFSSEESESNGEEVQKFSSSDKPLVEQSPDDVSKTSQVKPSIPDCDSSNEESESNDEENANPGQHPTLKSEEESLSGEFKVSPNTMVPTKSGTKIQPKVGSDTTNTPRKAKSVPTDFPCKYPTIEDVSSSKKSRTISENNMKDVSIKSKPTKSSTSNSVSSSEESKSKDEEIKKCTSPGEQPVEAKQKPDDVSKTQIQSSKAKPSISESDSSNEESESNDDEDEVSTSEVLSSMQLIITKSTTKIQPKVGSDSTNTPKKPRKSKLAPTDSSCMDSQIQDVSSPKKSTTHSPITNSETKTKYVPMKSKLTKPSTSNSDSSNEESKSNDEEVQRFTSSNKQLVKAKQKPDVSKMQIQPCEAKPTVPNNSSSDQDEENPESLTSKTSKTKRPAKCTPESKHLPIVAPKKSVTQTHSSSSSDSSGDSKELNPKASDLEIKSQPVVASSTIVDSQKQQLDNQRRIAAMEQRQKESEQQKKLIQGALSNVDTMKPNKSKHIVFDSEDDDDSTSKAEESTSQKKSLFEEDSEPEDEEQASSSNKEKKGASKLFDSDDDEEEDDGAEENRFQIKPQFEGKAGEKLMNLQARLGTDSRFKIDSRFVESDSESEDQDTGTLEKDGDQEELLEEKKKSLDILQSILKTSIQPQNSRKSKMFKDVSGLHYDPTRDEHAGFETKEEQPEKESKAARKKKRQELEKLPEVSKDIYFDVSGDLKAVFGASKQNKEEVPWDIAEEEEEEDHTEPMEVSNIETSADEGGFKFSFFSTKPAVETSKMDEYKIETLKPAKFSWSVDPRFQDSSSEEEDVEEAEVDQTANVTEESTQPRKSFFFFFDGDVRLTGGSQEAQGCLKANEVIKEDLKIRS
ncbi:hypothetical protein DNTS_022968 [Danionella cerebrum]|uniref:Nucleolar protein 8 n=1 Tax=Danionella cerebrum TaxID=2873325 RepID=A0A553RHF3_9TELE|nr:hypothetical protein DNTS_022968 [Danionella translucida]